ncbi:MAG: cytochrome P450 [Ilumatobacter sp.]|uniref:cytochrome P450 n=1 Tax=Ilumatobacter sp. TaxID=1967498 RepID=UPI0032993A66
MTYSHLEHANDVEPSVGHARLRAECPLHTETSHDPPFHVVSRHADVFDLLTRPEEWRNGFGVGVHPQPAGVLGTADDPDHRRHRRVLQDAFRPAAIAKLDDDVRDVCDELWTDAFGESGEGDFVRLFAFPFPAIVIAVLLGVPRERRDDFGRWSDDIVNTLGGADPALAEAANRHIFALVDELVDVRTGLHTRGDALPDDVLSVMTLAEIDGTLSHHEVRRLSQQLLVAGHETTASLISLMLYRLIEQPELMDRLRGDPELIPAAVEEFLRYDSPVQGLFRTNPEASTVCGEELPAESRVQALFASANRDADVYDAPDEIRLDRFVPGRRSHLAFGWGVHHCIGAALARTEGRVALSRMVEHFDTVERTGEVAINEPFILRGLTTLPIRWTVRR